MKITKEDLKKCLSNLDLMKFEEGTILNCSANSNVIDTKKIGFSSKLDQYRAYFEGTVSPVSCTLYNHCHECTTYPELYTIESNEYDQCETVYFTTQQEAFDEMKRSSHSLFPSIDNLLYDFHRHSNDVYDVFVNREFGNDDYWVSFNISKGDVLLIDRALNLDDSLLKELKDIEQLINEKFHGFVIESIRIINTDAHKKSTCFELVKDSFRCEKTVEVDFIFPYHNQPLECLNSNVDWNLLDEAYKQTMVEERKKDT
ncbi:hypothetical protein [Anaerorhabdus sp.]|uniref:hypothetical protein n=1 Tax=Anaerorhabdus sp. TaxID=1872524 RepID=UPI002FCA8D6B